MNINHPFCGLPQVPVLSEAMSNYLTQSYVLDTLGGHGFAKKDARRGVTCDLLTSYIWM